LNSAAIWFGGDELAGLIWTLAILWCLRRPHKQAAQLLHTQCGLT
jgi:hypothetical protein